MRRAGRPPRWDEWVSGRRRPMSWRPRPRARINDDGHLRCRPAVGRTGCVAHRQACGTSVGGPEQERRLGAKPFARVIRYPTLS
jgi:hypothetical protein